MKKKKICYLCGKEMHDDYSRDHVPAKQFFPSNYRSKGLQLVTLDAHGKCNQSYKDDEDYFFNSLSPLVDDAWISEAIRRDLRVKVSRPEGRGLAVKVLREFTSRLSSGIHLPWNKVAKRFDAKRVYGIIWKVIRGLYFHANGRVLPEQTQHCNWLWDSQIAQPSHWNDVRQMITATPSKSKYGRLFDYKILTGGKGNEVIQFWGMLFWNKLLFLTIFHDPTCGCDQCVKSPRGAGKHRNQ